MANNNERLTGIAKERYELLKKENNELRAENETLKEAIKYLMPKEQAAFADYANTITGVAGGEDGE